jgi:uncharacterized protein YqiB (DUF1249 family)
MLVALRKQSDLPRGRFAYLMGLYADNYWRLTRLFGPDRLAPGRYVSCCGDGLELHVDVLERHPYTLELRLSYAFADTATGHPEPSAHVKLYRDARVAEVTACYAESRLEDVIGRHADPRTVFEHRLRMNSFLNKWLEYLDERGHSRFTLQAVEPSPV